MKNKKVKNKDYFVINSTSGKKYHISPRMKELMGSVHIDPKSIEGDERAQYILNK